MIAIIDYGVGNLFSLKSSLEYMGAECKIVCDKQDIIKSNKIILPGVGAFGNAIYKLKQHNLDKTIIKQAKDKKPLLGICLGMQLLYEKSYEYGVFSGLGLIPGEIVSLKNSMLDKNTKVPHMGWNNLIINNPCPITENIKDNKYVYFVHSYYAPKNKYTVACANYGNVEISALVQRENIVGAQFHPEKSGRVGLEILKSFLEM